MPPAATNGAGANGHRPEPVRIVSDEKLTVHPGPTARAPVVVRAPAPPSPAPGNGAPAGTTAEHRPDPGSEAAVGPTITGEKADVSTEGPAESTSSTEPASAGPEGSPVAAAAAAGATRAQLRQMKREAGAPHGRRIGAARVVEWVLLAVVVAVVCAVVSVADVRVHAAPPTSSVQLSAASVGVVRGPAPDPGIGASLPWPASGQAAVAIPALGYSAQSGPEHPAPVASLTKLLTSYLILRDHPLPPGQDGPAITMTPADVSYYEVDTVTDQANAPVTAGEVLSERQLLEGLLIHSSDNLALALGAWDAGSVPAFVTKMNATAAELGMSNSHFVDPSGFDPQSQSTPADLLKVASLDMQIPTFAQIVQMTTVTFPPPAGLLGTYTPGLSGEPGAMPGVVGVKSGYTDAAGGGDVLALQRMVGGKPVVVLAAVTNQQGPNVLAAAGLSAMALATAVASHITTIQLPPAGLQVGTASVLGRAVPVVTSASGTLFAWPGSQIADSVTVSDRPPAGAATGANVGILTYRLGMQREAVVVRTTHALPAPSLLQRLF